MDKKLQSAEKLARKNDEGSITRAIKIYSDICLNCLDNVDFTYKTLISFITILPFEGIDMLARYQNMIPFCKDQQLDNLVEILRRVSINNTIPEFQRINCATTLYNHYFYSICYDCFGDIASDESINIDLRLEACRYLFGSEIGINKELAQECCISFIEDKKLSDKKRYEIICSFNSKTGISTVLNKSKIRVGFDWKFVYGLQNIYFQDKTNDIRYRLLSGQNLIQISKNDSEKESIFQQLIYIAQNIEYEENTRADAADIVMRLGTPEFVAIARQVISDLGYSIVNTGNNVLSRIKTVYNDSQNVHNKYITESVLKFIARMMKENSNPLPFDTVQNQIVDIVRKKKLSSKSRIKVLKSLHRVSIDTATFTEYDVAISEILIHVWMKICTYPQDIKEELESRLIEELLEMQDTCSSGYASRFVNVLTSQDTYINISIEEQIKANLVGRINARIGKLPENERDAIGIGTMIDALPDEKLVYENFIKNALDDLYKELYDEFVPEFVSDQQFDLYFNNGKQQFII